MVDKNLEGDGNYYEIFSFSIVVTCNSTRTSEPKKDIVFWRSFSLPNMFDMIFLREERALFLRIVYLDIAK